ncbi:MAG: hypothetical protein KDA63_08140, partial [Planctomycetales bacterium]|nr:hypothetical protein [Planctomycetales bacterium]
YAWQSMLLMGFGSGACVLLGVAATASRPRWYFRLPLVVLASLLVGLFLAWFDWFVPSLWDENYWPPTDVAYVSSVGVADETHPLLIWFAITLVTTSVVAGWLTVATLARTAHTLAHRQSWQRRAARTACFAVSVSIAVFPTFVLWRLLTPGRVPVQQLPIPNAYDTIVAVGDSVEASPFATIESDWDWETVPTTMLAPAIQAIESDLAQLRHVLSQQSEIPLKYTQEDYSNLPFSRISNHRSLARALLSRARLAQLDGDPGRALELRLDTVRLGYVVRRGGLITEELVGIAVSGIGTYYIYMNRDSLKADECLHTSEVLLELDRKKEPFEQVNERDRLWTRIAFGWHAHLQQITDDVSGWSAADGSGAAGAFLREQVTTRLLAVELALRAFQLEHGQFPATLGELVPEYIDHLPSDPFDPSGGPLRYTRTDDGYLLYSVGADGRDNGGAPPEDAAMAMFDNENASDLRLDVLITGTSNATPSATGSTSPEATTDEENDKPDNDSNLDNDNPNNDAGQSDGSTAP